MDPLCSLAREPSEGCSQVARTHFVTGSLSRKVQLVLPMRSQVLSHTFSRAKIHTFSHLHNIHTAFPIKTKSLQHIPKLCVKYADFNITPANIGAAGLIATIHNLPTAGAELNFPLSIPEDLSEDISSHV